MAEYIEREAAITTALDAVEIHPSQVGCLKEALSEIPTADVRPVVHGRWINVVHAIVDTTGNCSECGKEAVWRTRRKPYAICPNCGTEMREANNEH